MPSEDYDIELPFGVPPVLPSVQNQLKKYLLCPELLPIHSIDNTQQLWTRTPQPSLLLNAELAPTGTSLKVIRHHASGEILGFDEIQIKGCGEKADNSFSLQRAPGLPTDSVRGSTRNLPFWPGGFAEPEDVQDLVKVSTAGLDGEDDLETVPPGFSHEVLFMPDGRTPVSATTRDKEEPAKIPKVETPEAAAKPSNVVNIFDLVEQEKEFLEGKTEASDSEIDPLADEANVDADIIPKPKALPVPPVLQIRHTPRVASKRVSLEWAEELDVTEPMKDFKERLPNPALTYEFELDTFQKQAILKLEERQDVFVAAHTSAGKTVVAEYAIALSRKHNCRTVYTSPIKALSNQKFRDFRDKFDDVGLITGDLQKNEKASCLIMTTEILRSMLYGGSDVIRDLEYVVLDEVHYLNDNERGHVWEEVLILLPKHVSVVLLSATVPNVLQFANWVGRTREKKMYVVATTKRPVPLEHYLYTGWGGATKDDRFMVLGQDGVFNKYNYEEAERKLKTSSKAPRARLTPAQEKTIWSGLIAHLKKKEGLPVVAFTLSRKRCDLRAQLLASMESAGDLTTSDEKHKIRRFFIDCTERLCKQDRDLPQVVTMNALLSKGIGVHHSGILPFLKEVVEMLFQVGLVKLLFATETFAMGVNMPARTVLFDTIVKYDGIESRPLKPDEYIQMAGRAGRRGLDEKGIVLLLCSGGLPKEDILRSMMIGKPTNLVSKFRLTYQMMLKLLRAGRLTVGEMMSKSFQEDVRSDKSAQIIKKLKEAQQQIKEWKRPAYLDEETEKFCLEGLDWIQRRDGIWKKHFTPCFGKLLQPGRVLLICHKNHRCKLGVYINTNNDLLEVLVLSNSDEIKRDKMTDEDVLYETKLSKLFWLAKPREVFVPGGQVVHELLKVPIADVVEVTAKCLPKDCMPNPKDFFFMRKCGGMVEELTLLCSKLPEYLQSQNKAYDIKSDFLELDRQKAPLLSWSCYDLPNFGEQFLEFDAGLCSQLVAAFEKYKMEERLSKYKLQVSDESLQLNDEKEKRLLVLKELQYIDSDNQVQMKGRVACGMGSKELMITELVMHNVLTKRPVEEIAALLSGLVFQVKSNEDSHPKYSESLKEGIELVNRYHEEIAHLERKYAVQAGPDENPPNFGLAEVVYAWAKNKPFKDIMALTDCQEGLIVRCIQQLNELMLDVKLAARMIGDEELETKMDDASKAIKRDIVFSASLYTEMGKINL